MKITNPINREYMLNHLERGYAVKTSWGHYAVSREGLIFVSETAHTFESVKDFISHATAMTWDSFLYLYPIEGDINAAANGRAR